MSRRSSSPFWSASLASLGILGIVTIAACSSPALVTSKGNKGKGDTSSPGTFGDGSDPGSDTDNTAACAPDKANAEIPGNDCDDDDDGTVDNPVVCDSAAADSPEDFAKTMGICESASAKGYGLVSAKFTRGYGREDAPMAQQHGILPKFGNVLKPREGGMLGVLSTGFAQEFDGAPGVLFGGNASGKDWFGADFGSGGGNGTAPPGYPKASASCPIATDVNDVIDLRLELKAPPNASGFKFDFNFHSGEWPAFICSRFNDGFVAYLAAKGFNNGTPDNISFDAMKSPVSVNNGFFDRCTPNAAIGCEQGAKPGTSTCPGGPDELAGTGFGVVGSYCRGGGSQTVSGGATGWLSSQAPVQAGETFTLDLMIWDTGDGDLDSSVLLDNFQWVAGTVTTSTERPKGPN